ncbi:hypothetical protein [Vulcanisaeta souniana]|uniref:hypothetical protein n=1 Tax=Vulcanisaeta souniana TaxID=164452 RepID=UPI001FB50B50|nr:hypothetical protein [Vulcanisaeta souniana]
MSLGGYPIVLTGEVATMSDTHGSSVVGFASAIPENYFRDWVARRFFRLKSNREGRVFRAPLWLIQGRGRAPCAWLYKE